MTSIFENTHSRVVVHILHDDTLTSENRQKFIRTAEKYSQGLELIDVAEHVKRIDNSINKLMQIMTVVEIGTLYRLFIPEVVDVSKILYLDCDIVVNLDIRELWNVDVENYCLAGVHTMGKSLSESLRSRLNGCNSEMCVNAGVLIMNLDMIRRKEENLFNASMKWMLKRKHLVFLSDQDILNALFTKHMKLIGRKYNNCNPKTLEQVHNSIVHTPNIKYALKTWGLYGLPSQRLYWKYYVRSAWGENKSAQELAEVFVTAAEKSMASSPYTHRTKQYIAEVSRRIVRRVFYGNTAATIIRYLFKEAYYRVTHIFSRA